MKIGEVIARRFQVDRWVANGGMSTVFAARDLKTGGTVALKILAVRSDEGARRFVREIEALATIDDPLIVRYIAHGTLPEGDAYLATEWLEGVVLAQLFVTRRLTVGESLGLVVNAARALGRAHERGLVHRDVTPRNLMVLREGRPPIKLLDFGLVKALDRVTGLTRTGQPLGTPGYLAPEQLLGESNIDPRSDVFGLGCIFYECLTGRRPFPADRLASSLRQTLFDDPPAPHELAPDVSVGISALVMRMIAKNREDRPENGAIVAKLVSALRTLGLSMRSPSRGPTRS